jgi:hypothetical protein
MAIDDYLRLTNRKPGQFLLRVLDAGPIDAVAKRPRGRGSEPFREGTRGTLC